MKWLRRDDQWVKINRFGEVADTATEAELNQRPRREREVILRAPVDDGRHSS